MPIEVRLAGKLTLVKPLQPLKAIEPIEVRLLQPDKFTLVKPVHLSKAFSPIEVRLAGKLTLVKPLQRLKA